MAKRFDREAAELEANEIAFQFRNSHDVVGDMSRAYHTDFSGIRMHEDADAQARVRAAGTDALAKGSDLYFRKGILGGHDQASRGLVAHELAHTMQQGIVTGSVQESAPAGAEQGGFVDWIKDLFGGKKRKQKKFAQQRAMAKTQQGDMASRASSQEELAGLGNSLRGVVKNSNMTWNGSTTGDTKLKLSYAAFGASAPRTDQYQKNAAIHKRLFFGSNAQYSNYMQTLDASGVKYKDLISGDKHNDYSTSVAGDMYDIVGDYLMTDQGLAYASQFTTNLKDAAVFAPNSGSKQSPVDYLLRTVIGTEASKAGDAFGMRGNFLQKGAGVQAQRKQFGSNVKDSMIYGASLASMSEEERRALPENVQTLYAKYQELAEKLSQELAVRGML